MDVLTRSVPKLDPYRIPESFQSIQDYLSSMMEQIDYTLSRHGVVIGQANMDETLQQLEAIRGQVGALSSNLAALNSSLASLTGRVTTDETNITDITTRIGTLETQMSDITARMTTAEGNITSLDARVTALGG